MPRERNAFKLGLTLIVFIVLLVGVLVWLAPSAGGDMNLRVRFPHEQVTAQLPAGSPVLCAGQIVGKVNRSQLVRMMDEESQQEKLFSVTTIEVESHLKLTDRCRIVPVGPILGGAGQIVIENVGDGEPLSEGALVDGVPEASIADLTRSLAEQLDPDDPNSLLALIQTQLNATDPLSLMGKIHQAIDDVQAVTGSLRREFNPNERAVLLVKLHSILDHVNEMTGLLRDEVDRSNDAALVQQLHQTLDTLNSGLATAAALLEENRVPITETIGHVRETAKILEEQIATRIARQVDVSSPASLMAKVHVSIDRMGEALENIRVITGAARETVTLNKEQIGRIITNLKETSDHLKAAGKDIRRNPWRLLYQPSDEEVAEANLFDAARAFSEAATRLDDAVTRLEAVTEAGSERLPADDPVLLTVMEELQETFKKFNKAEAALWEQLKIK